MNVDEVNKILADKHNLAMTTGFISMMINLQGQIDISGKGGR